MQTARRITSTLLTSVLVVFAFSALAEEGLQKCATAFPGRAVENAPKIFKTTGRNLTQICERSGNTVFFGLEYDADKLAPIWVGYRIADTFGTNGCASMTRQQMRCHFKAEEVEECINEKTKLQDPFHVDPVLEEQDIDRLRPNSFTATGHDRGHMSPNSTFSCHACGAFKTFTMANMAAQWGSLNQQLWASLEQQVLFWGVNDGPVPVAPGPIGSAFPNKAIRAIEEGEVEPSSFPKVGELLKKTNGKPLSIDVVRPTGFYKVVFRPARNNEPARAIAFLAPHTKEKGLEFWTFVVPVKVVEQASGLKFGFGDEFKGDPDLAFWQAPAREVPSGWSPRSDCKARERVAGWMAEKSLADRVAICTSNDPAP